MGLKKWSYWFFIPSGSIAERTGSHCIGLDFTAYIIVLFKCVVSTFHECTLFDQTEAAYFTVEYTDAIVAHIKVVAFLPSHYPVPASFWTRLIFFFKFFLLFFQSGSLIIMIDPMSLKYFSLKFWFNFTLLN